MSEQISSGWEFPGPMMSQQPIRPGQGTVNDLILIVFTGAQAIVYLLRGRSLQVFSLELRLRSQRFCGWILGADKFKPNLSMTFCSNLSAVRRLVHVGQLPSAHQAGAAASIHASRVELARLRRLRPHIAQHGKVEEPICAAWDGCRRRLDGPVSAFAARCMRAVQSCKHFDSQSEWRGWSPRYRARLKPFSSPETSSHMTISRASHDLVQCQGACSWQEHTGAEIAADSAHEVDMQIKVAAALLLFAESCVGIGLPLALRNLRQARWWLALLNWCAKQARSLHCWLHDCIITRILGLWVSARVWLFCRLQ
jgi:hypothetical protein